MVTLTQLHSLYECYTKDATKKANNLMFFGLSQSIFQCVVAVKEFGSLPSCLSPSEIPSTPQKCTCGKADRMLK